MTKSLNLQIKNPFYLVENSPWPFVTATAVIPFILLILDILHHVNTCAYDRVLRVVLFLLPIYYWFYDLIIEGTFLGLHTTRVQKGITIGFILFLLSEVMFFFAIFRSFFYFSVSPSVWIGNIWPPKGVTPISPWGIALLNTVILVSSGFYANYAHILLVAGDRNKSLYMLLVTIALGILFTGFQLYEYNCATFSINDSVFGSVFFFSTGFHGFHVLIGTLFLIFSFLRHLFYHFMREHHLGLKFAIWYWHFVDVIWIFLYLFVYIWGGK